MSLFFNSYLFSTTKEFLLSQSLTILDKIQIAIAVPIAYLGLNFFNGLGVLFTLFRQNGFSWVLEEALYPDFQNQIRLKLVELSFKKLELPLMICKIMKR